MHPHLLLDLSEAVRQLDSRNRRAVLAAKYPETWTSLIDLMDLQNVEAAALESAVLGQKCCLKVVAYPSG